MIKLPKSDNQSMFDYETYFSLTMNEERLGKFLAHYEAMKIAENIPGEIVECGVFKGTSLMRFAIMRQLMGGDKSARIYGFDVFSDKYPNTKFAEDKVQRDHWIKTAGGKSIGDKQLSKLFKKKNINNFSLIAGDVNKTIPRFKKQNPGFKISLLNIDIDFVEPTLTVLNNFYDCVTKGGIILLDNYAGRGNSGKYLFGDTKAIDVFFKKKSIQIKRFSFAARPCYIIKK
tara:strand:- start:828 stop:1517 length:690 start_codon:yes stop_codon:yes gene_type:complete